MDRVDARATKSFSPRKKLIYCGMIFAARNWQDSFYIPITQLLPELVFSRVARGEVADNFCEGSALLESESRRKDLFYGPVSCERSTGFVNYTRNIPVKKQLEPRPPLLPPLWNKVRDLGSKGNLGSRDLIPSESSGLGLPSLRS